MGEVKHIAAPGPKTDRYWPIDGLGNQIRKDDLIRMDLPEKALLFRVVEVEPATLIPGPQDSQIPVDGSITLVAQIKLPYHPTSNFPKILVLQEPERSPIVKPS